MRYAAYLLIVASLVAGSLAATTAYAPQLETVAAGAGPLTLAAPAGRDPAAPDQPAVAPGDAARPVRLTPEVVERLKTLEVERVRVKEFSLARWDQAWIFGLAMVGLVAGGVMIRRETKVRLSGPKTAADGTSSPHDALDLTHRDIEALLREIPETPERERPDTILRRIDAIQAAHLSPFIAARSALMARYGVAGFARLMDPFAAGERRLNRAWSAAADRVLPEAIASLEQALAAFDAARARLVELETRSH
jgi:hypothetical protein